MNNMIEKPKFSAHVVAYVKYGSNNLSTITSILISIVSCEVFALLAPFIRSCWGHAMSKCCQHATKVCVSLTLILIKEA
jgi:hypothetical protein